MRVSACVIVKNEEKNLPLWLDSMSRIADELVVVDTGSTDGTVAVAEAAGARVEYFRWVDDFSAAKNYAIERASGDWILLLDADEYFRSEDCPGVRAAIEKYDMDRKVAGLMFLRVDIEQTTGLENGGSMHVVRAFRNVPWLRYVRRIHEELRNLSGKGIKIMQYVKDLVIYHTGYSSEVFPDKLRRNLELLLKEENREPIDDFYFATCYYNLGRYDEAIAHLKQLIEAKVKMTGMENAPYTFLIHSMILAEYPSTEIYGALREAVRKYPDVPEFHIMWGFQDWRCGDRVSAEGHYLKALKLNEEERRQVKKKLVSNFSANLLPKAYLHLGELAIERGRNQEAEAYLEKAMQLQPDNERVREMLCRLRENTLTETKDASMEKPIDENELEELRRNIYGALERRDYNSASVLLQKLLPYKEIEALELMTCVAIERGDTKAAEKVLKKLRAAQKKLTPYQSFLEARVLFMEDRIIETLAALKKVQVHKATPEQQEKIYNLMGQCHKFLGENKKATDCYLKAFRATTQGTVAFWEYSNYLFNLHYLSTSIQEQRRAAEGYQKIFDKTPYFHHSPPEGKKKKLRIGYISPDLRNHVVLRFSHALFSKYNRERFEVYLYANNPEDGYSRSLADKVEHWQNILGWSAEEAARRIYEDKIDILVDLAGHTKENCLPVLAYKPAPIQISGIGYFASTGLSAVDYFLGDVHMDNEETEKGFTEELLLLPESHFCYSEMKNSPEVEEAPCKRNGYITFGSFNDFPKVNDEVLRVWAEILRLVPDSRLLLKAKVFEREDSRELMLKRIQKAGIPLERVETRGTSKVYMPEYNDMDIALDTFPYPGGGTTWDALYGGVPVISWRGKSHGERFGASLLENIGLGELCADTREDYVKKAVSLAGDRELVAVLHSNLRNMMRNSPLMNASRYMSNMEAAYEAVWERYVGENTVEALEKKTDEAGGDAAPEPFLHEIEKHRHDKLRIGYISSDFGSRPIACFVSPFFRNFDAYVFQIHVYSLGESNAAAGWLGEGVTKWHDFDGISAEEIAKRIYKDEIDVLVDMSTEKNSKIMRILSYRPAPIQIRGMIGTGDSDTVDYLLGDSCENAVDVPVDKLLRLPGSRLCYKAVPGMPDYIAPAPFILASSEIYQSPCPPLEGRGTACGGGVVKAVVREYRKVGHVTFGCIDPLARVSDEMLLAWKAILEKTEGSVLLLKSHMSDEIWDEQRDRERMKRLGLPMKRIFLETAVPDQHEYYDSFQKIDILLDSCVPSEDGRVCDALYMGVPVVTLKGGIAASMLMNGGFEKLCAGSLEEYAAAAEALAKNSEELTDLHLTLRWKLECTSAMDADRYMPEFEYAIGTVFCDWQREHSSDFTKWQERTWQEFDRADEAGERELAVRLGNWLAWSKDSHDRLPFWTAGSYYFLKDEARSIYWGEKAYRIDILDERALVPTLWGLDRKGRRFEAIELCNQVLRYKDRLRDEVRRMVMTLRGRMAYISGVPEATPYYREAYEEEKAWESRPANFSSWLVTYNSKDVDRSALLKKHKSYEELFRRVKPYSHSGRRHSKIRLGYISPDFRKHVMYEFIRPFFQFYDKESFEVYAYSLAKEPDDCTNWFKQMADGWRELSPYTPELTAKQIFEDEIDILFDLAGHTADTGLPALAWKPAPVQISGLGYMTTTGLSAVDYFLTDEFMDPPGEHEEDFVEKLLHVKSQLCYKSLTDNLPQPSTAPCRERGWVLFGAFNGYHKITDEMLLAWKRILDEVPASKILFKCQVFFAPSMKLAAYNRFKRIGFDMNRVILEPATREYMNRYLDVDIALDTYPYPGGGTTCDALYMGVPVISRYSDRHSTRFAYSILQNVGVGELATDSLEGYIERAVAVAKDWELLEYLHRNLRSMMEKSPVMDAKGYMREIEARYREIWERWLKSGRD